MSERGRKRAIVEASVSESGYASEVAHAIEYLGRMTELHARATCAKAVAQHSKSVADQIEKAACLWTHVNDDFRDVEVSPQTQAWLAQLFRIDPKTMGKRTWGPGR